jgi:hypothetical protein
VPQRRSPHSLVLRVQLQLDRQRLEHVRVRPDVVEQIGFIAASLAMGDQVFEPARVRFGLVADFPQGHDAKGGRGRAHRVVRAGDHRVDLEAARLQARAPRAVGVLRLEEKAYAARDRLLDRRGRS